MREFWNSQRVALVARMTVLMVIVGFGTFLRLHDIDVSLYDDEISTREQALRSVRLILETCNDPVYYLLAKGSLTLGDTEAALRLPSLVAGLLCIIASYGFITRIHSHTSGLVAAAIVAFSPFHINYSTVARSFGLLIFFALLTLWCLHGILERGRFRDWIGFTVFAFLSLSTQFSFLPVFASMGITAALYLLGCKSKGTLRRRVGLTSLLLLCSLLASGFLLYKILPIAHGLSKGEETRTVLNVVSKEGTSYFTLASPVGITGERPQGGGLVDKETVPGETRYRLTFYDCIAYLRAFFWNETNWLWPVLLMLGVWGFFDIWYRVPTLAVPLTGGLILGPVSLFFVSSAHWYHVQYLSCVYMYTVVLVACGACVLPRFLSRVFTAPRSVGLWRRMPSPHIDSPVSPASLVYAAIVLGLALPMVPIQNTAYNTYPVDGYLPRGPLVNNRVPIRDWKRLHEFTAQTARDGDTFVYMTPQLERGDLYTQYYLSRFLRWQGSEHHIDERFSAPSAELLEELATSRPFSNLWFIGYQNYNAEGFIDFFNDANAAHFNYSFLNLPKGLRLFALGGPTTNHIANGNFEQRTKGDQPRGISKTAENAYAGALALLVEVNPADVSGKESWQSMFRTPVSPAAYRLRNNGFEAWKDGVPVGWHANNTASISMSPEGHEASRGLKLAPASETVVLQQSIEIATAPGRTLEVQAMGKSGAADNLQLVLRYAGPGFQEEVRATHPGNGEWVQMHLEAGIPANTDPRSIAVELWRMAGGEGEAIVDNVELRVRDLGGTLDPSIPYVLSLAVRSENLAHKSGSAGVPAGRVRLAWVDDQGKEGTRDLIGLCQNSSWHKLSVPVRPGIDIPVALKELYLEIGIVDGVGTLSFDEIQLEEGDRPTLYTDTFRLPHDESLAGRDLTKHPVAVNWQAP